MKKNILLLTIDALGADKCWGLKKSLTPNIKRLNQQGAIFTNAISTTSSTTPSLASIHTGLYPFQHGIKSTYGFRLKASAITIAEILKDNGYSTFANVGGPLTSPTNLNRGFDHYVYRPAHLMLPIFKYRFAIKVARINSFLLMREADKIFKLVEPWFYWIHLLDLHNRWRSRRWSKNDSLSDYEFALTNVDKKIGRLLNAININKTMVIIAADHGHHVSTLDPKRAGIDYAEAHGFSIYDTLVHVPLIMVCRGLISEELRINKQVSTIDIFPTILDILKIKQESNFAGKSFADLILLKGADKQENYLERPVYMEACGSILKRTGKSFLIGIRTPEWKIIVPKDRNSILKPELFDLKSDPDELVNVYDNQSLVAQQLLLELQNIIAKNRC
jgi:arylsulfatase A-like enzyme